MSSQVAEKKFDLKKYFTKEYLTTDKNAVRGVNGPTPMTAILFFAVVFALIGVAVSISLALINKENKANDVVAADVETVANEISEATSGLPADAVITQEVAQKDYHGQVGTITLAVDGVDEFIEVNVDTNTLVGVDEGSTVGDYTVVGQKTNGVKHSGAPVFTYDSVEGKLVDQPRHTFYAAS